MKNYPVFLVFIFYAFVSNAQEKMIVSQWAYINYDDYTVKAEVLSSKTKIKTDPSRTYAWYAFNKVMFTKGGYDGKLLHGIYKTFYLSNNLKEQGYYNKGLKSSKWITWYDNGMIKETCYWKGGLKDGLNEFYDPDGQLSKSMEYKNDVLNGESKTFEKGKMVSTQKFKNGVEVIKPPAEKKEKAKRQKKEVKHNTDSIKSPGPKSPEPVNKKVPVKKDSTNVQTKKEPAKTNLQGNKEGLINKDPKKKN